MKKIISLIFLVILVQISTVTLNAQCPSDIKGNPNCPDHQLYEDQAVIRIQEFKNKIASFDNELKVLEGDLAGFEKKLEDTKTAMKECDENIYKMIGATSADVSDFRQKIGVIEGKIREMQRLSDDVLADRQKDVFALEGELNELRQIKISVLPEFFPKIMQLAKQINPGLIREKKIKEYIVKSWFENKDCLWNIAGNVDIYGDPFQWPKIWQANTSMIRNPDIIHPGQALTIPPAGPKSADEMKAERKYWREKREAIKAQTEAAGEQGKQ